MHRDGAVNLAGDARDGREALELVRTLHPDILLVDAKITGIDATDLTQQVTTNFPNTAVIVLSPVQDMDLFRRVMRAGAADCLTKPVSAEDLSESVHEVHAQLQRRKAARAPVEELPTGQTITVYSPQGGSGKSMLAANLAVALAMHSGGKTALIDLNLQFGDIDLMLNLQPANSIAGLAQKHGEFDADLVESYLTEHDSGLKVLVAPSTPQYAETITVFVVEQVLSVLKQSYGFIVIDTPSILQDTTLAALDYSDRVLLLTTLDLLALHNTKTALEMLQQLYSAEKLRLVLNRANANVGITAEDVESTLGVQIASHIPSDGHIVVPSINQGEPFVRSHPDAPITKQVIALAYNVMGRELPPDLLAGAVSKAKKVPGWKKLLLGA